MDEQVDETLARLEQALPDLEAALPRGTPSSPAPAADNPLSPTLAALAPARRPRDGTACETCPNSVWFASPAEVKCYCRVMYLVTWSTREPNRIISCDGAFLGQD